MILIMPPGSRVKGGIPKPRRIQSNRKQTRQVIKIERIPAELERFTGQHTRLK
jgi:hypothetical protein